MLKILWTRFFYRFYFTVWLTVFSAIGGDGMIAFYWAAGVGLVIDLVRAKFVSTELTGDGSWRMHQWNKFSDLWNFRENIIYSVPLMTTLYIWLICILDMYAPSQTMDFYFGLFEPFYSVIGSQFEFVRDQARDLKMNGYDSKALLTQHIYTVGLLSLFIGSIRYTCFVAHPLTAPWVPDNERALPDPMTEVWKTFFGVIFIAIIWAGWNLLEVEFTKTHRRTINIHEGYIIFALYFPCMLIGTQALLSWGFSMVISARDMAMRKI